MNSLPKRSHTLKIIFILILIIVGIDKYSIARQIVLNTQVPTLPFSNIVVKKSISGKLCDSCKVDFAFTAVPDFSYLITGSSHTPKRLARKRLEAQYTTRYANADVYLISNGHIGITFLPNYILEHGKRLQIWRNFNGVPYPQLEFQVRQNKSIIKNWFPLSSLKEDRDYKILGMAGDENQQSITPWKGNCHAGDFELKVNDSLYITVRNIGTKKVVKTIAIFRAVDKATNFLYYQIPLSNEQFAMNIQNVLNIRNNSFKFYRGDSSKVFEKDYDAIGILRFAELEENEEIEYSFGSKPFRWQSVNTRDQRTGIFVVLPSDMPDGEDHEIFLRYKSQRETIHSITIKVKKRPFEFPWVSLTVGFMLVTAMGIVFFYLRERRNKQKILALARKNKETESSLALLSGQLNPHFLFNTLNAIQGTINSNNPERANADIGNVARFMREVMNNGQKEFVSLMEELKMEEDYLQLEQQRINFDYVITIGTGLESTLIDFPPLLLQPVLENSIRHAFGTDLSAPLLKIDVQKLNNNLIIEIIDNGSIAWDAEHNSEGHGLSLTRKRIAIYNEKLQYIAILMNINYVVEKGTIATFTFKNWLA